MERHLRAAATDGRDPLRAGHPPPPPQRHPRPPPEISGAPPARQSAQTPRTFIATSARSSRGTESRHCERRRPSCPAKAGHPVTPRLLGSITAASGILDHPPARVMTLNMTSHSRDADRPRFAFRLPSRLLEGAGKTGCLLHPRSRVRFALTKTAHEHTGQREHSGLPCAMALRLTSCSPRRTALLPPSLPESIPHNLTPAPRRPNHRTSPYASGAYVYRAFRVHRISPRVRDDRRAPLICRETDGVMHGDLGENESGIFLIPGLDATSENQK